LLAPDSPAGVVTPITCQSHALTSTIVMTVGASWANYYILNSIMLLYASLAHLSWCVCMLIYRVFQWGHDILWK